MRATFAAPPSPDGSRTKTRSRLRASSRIRSREAPLPSSSSDVRRSETPRAGAKRPVARRPENGEEDREPGLHVEDARSRREVPTGVERLRREGAEGPHRVEVAEEERPSGLGPEPGEDAVPATLERDALRRDSRRREAARAPTPRAPSPPRRPPRGSPSRRAPRGRRASSPPRRRSARGARRDRGARLTRSAPASRA